jgi:16S rRNA (guanine527-N7)-methyltransferase
MEQGRIAELLAPFLGPDADLLAAVDLESISIYIDLLIRWNARVNLTAIRDPEEMVTRHFGESLFLARHLFPGTRAQGASAVADVGSGAGFPGIPIKIWVSGIGLTLIESNHKKVAFLREVCRALTLMDVDIQNVRAEEVSGGFDVVTLRAVERFAEILPVVGRLVKVSGQLGLLISRGQIDEARAILPIEWGVPVLVPGSESRVVMIGSGNMKSSWVGRS